MKFSKIVTSTIGATIIGGGIYMVNSSDGIHPSIQINEPLSTQKVKEIQLQVPAILIPEMRTQIRAGGSDDDVINWLNKNQVLKMRIQGTSWYRDFLTGKMSSDDFHRHITDANSIEEIIIKYPGILENFQFSDSWQEYLGGEKYPGYILNGPIHEMVMIEEGKEKYPDMHVGASHNPIWNKDGNANSEETIRNRAEIIQSVIAQLTYIQNHPSVAERINKFGFQASDLHTGEFGSAKGVYGVIDAIYTIENTANDSPIIFSEFQNSDIGKGYGDGKINPNNALEYLNQLLAKSNENK